MSILSGILPSPSLKHFTNALNSINRPIKRRGPIVSSSIGNIGVEFDNRTSTLTLDYSDTPLKVKKSCPVTGPITIQGMIANAVVHNAAFVCLAEFNGWKYLGASRDNQARLLMVFEKEWHKIGVGTNENGKIICQPTNAKADPNKFPTLRALLSRDLFDEAFDTIKDGTQVWEPNKSKAQDVESGVVKHSIKQFSKDIEGPIAELIKLMGGDHQKLSIVSTSIIAAFNKSKDVDQNPVVDLCGI